MNDPVKVFSFVVAIISLIFMIMTTLIILDLKSVDDELEQNIFDNTKSIEENSVNIKKNTQRLNGK